MSDCRSRNHLIPAWSHSFMGIDHELISTPNLLISTDSRRVVFHLQVIYVQEVLISPLVKLAHKKVWLDELTIPTDMTIAVDWDIIKQKQKVLPLNGSSHLSWDTTKDDISGHFFGLLLL